MRRLLGMMLVAGSIGLTTSQTVYANVAANAQILNSASLSYKDGGFAQTTTASVTVVVGTVLCSPITIVAPVDQSAVYSESAPGTGNASVVYNYAFDACGNGPADYAISSVVAASTNSGNPTAPAAAPSVATVAAAGASVTVSGSTLTVINVPADGVNDGAVNGIAVNDTIVIGGGDVRTVTAITDPVSGIATIAVAALTAAPGVGVDIVERSSFTVTVTSGDILAAGSDITVNVNTTVSSAAGANTTTDPTLTTFTSGLAVMSKLVRNVTTGVAGTAPAVGHAVNGVTNNYYAAGVTGKGDTTATGGAPGDVLEYILVIKNTGTGSVTEATVTDTLPVDVLQFVGNIRVIVENAAGAVVSDTTRTATADTDTATYAAPVLSVNVGDAGPLNAPPGIGGTISAGFTIKVVYQASIR